MMGIQNCKFYACKKLCLLTLEAKYFLVLKKKNVFNLHYCEMYVLFVFCDNLLHNGKFTFLKCVKIGSFSIITYFKAIWSLFLSTRRWRFLLFDNMECLIYNWQRPPWIQEWWNLDKDTEKKLSLKFRESWRLDLSGAVQFSVWKPGLMETKSGPSRLLEGSLKGRDLHRQSHWLTLPWVSALWRTR
jgi:hypothetical protein